MIRFTSYRRYENFGKNFQRGGIWAYFEAVFASFTGIISSMSNLIFLPCKVFVMNCFTPYYYCANFGNIQKGEMSRDFDIRFAVTTVKTTNNPDNILITSQSYPKIERDNQAVTLFCLLYIQFYGKERTVLSSLIYKQLSRFPERMVFFREIFLYACFVNHFFNKIFSLKNCKS
jgi:hypothetical protein